MKSPEHELKPRLLPSVPVAIAAMVAIALVGAARWSRSAPRASDPTGGRVMSQKKYTKPSTAELKKKLTGVQYEVTQNAAHRAAVPQRLLEQPRGRPLRRRRHRRAAVQLDRQVRLRHRLAELHAAGRARAGGREADSSHGMDARPRCARRPAARTWATSSTTAGAHGPALLHQLGVAAVHPGRQARGRGLRRVPAAVRRRGQGHRGGRARRRPRQHLHAAARPGEAPGCTPTLETAILAGGCFWGMEDILRKIPGVLETEVGYTGGTTAHPTYEDVHTGTTGHAESVRVVFDPKKLSYDDLLEKWFFRMHDPTTHNRQGNDVGTQYRSAIFVTSAEQRKVAERRATTRQKSGKLEEPRSSPQIVEAGPFTPAEDYHQKYLEKNPGGYTCHYVRN